EVRDPVRPCVRISKGKHFPLLHSARLCARQVGPEPPQAHRRDDVLEPLGGGGAVVMTGKPAVSLAAVPGRRRTTIEMAQRLEREGFGGIYCSSLGDGMALCEALALMTREIPFGTRIANLSSRHPSDYAHTAAFIHEVSGGRFRFGIGVSHGPAHERLGVTAGKPLAEVRRFVKDLESWTKTT